VRGKNDGGAALALFEDGGAEHFEIHRVQAGEWFVEDEQLRLRNHGGDELDFLRHALGERLDFVIRPLFQAHLREPVADGLARVAAVHALERA